MREFVRLNQTAESILKILLGRPASPNNLAFALRCDKVRIGENLKFLLAESYVINPKCKDVTLIRPDDDYKITSAGENYLSSVRFVSIRDKRQFIINVINASISLTALVKAFWNEISGLLSLLMQ